MIALLKGEVAIRRSDHVVVLCGGVGYRAAVSAETLRHVPAVGGETTLHTHLVVRDDALLLARLSLRAGARPVPDAAVRTGGGSEGGGGGALQRLPARAVGGDRGRRRRALPGGAGDRQAHRRADHRGAAREGRASRAGSRASWRAAPARTGRARWRARGCSRSATTRSKPRNCCGGSMARAPRS